MTPDDLKLLAMESALTENRLADSCWVNNDTLVVATIENGRPHLAMFSREILLEWQRRAWDLGRTESWLEFDELLAATYERPPPELLPLEQITARQTALHR